MTTSRHALGRALTGWPRGAALAALVLALGGWEPFRTADPDVEAGNRAYADGRYDDAIAAYDRAARSGGVDAGGLAFDRGTAEARKAEVARDPAEKQRLVQRALDDLQQASHARDPRIRGAASYNRGNLLMGQDKLDDAIEAYKQALREQPGLDDARLNLELALRRRQKQPQLQPQQGQGQGQGQGQDQGQGQGQGQGQQAQPGQGQGGANPPPGGGSGQGSDAQGSGGQGAGPPSGGGQGANPSQSGGNGQGANPPQNGGSGQGTTPPQNGNRSPDGSTPPRGRAQRGRRPQSPRTPTDGKLDDLDTYSRRLQRDQARRQATGRAADPQHDW